MRLNDVVGMMFNGAAARLRRDALMYGTCAVCGVAALILASSASLIALEPIVGAVYSRLIVGGVFVLIALIVVVSVRLCCGRGNRMRTRAWLRQSHRYDNDQRDQHEHATDNQARIDRTDDRFERDQRSR